MHVSLIYGILKKKKEERRKKKEERRKKKEEERGAPGWLSQLSIQLLVLAQVMISRSRDGAQVGLHTQQGVGLEFFLPLPLPLPSPTCVRTFFPLLNKYINIKKKKKR